MRTLIFFWIVVSLLMIWGTCGYTQYNDDSPNTDRPGQAINPNTVGWKVLQVQTGVGDYPFKVGSGPWQHGIGLNKQLRWGIREKIELNAGINVFVRNNITFVSNTWDWSVPSFEFGGRINLLNGKGIFPALGVNAAIFFPTVNFLEPGQRIFITQSNRWDRFSVNANIGFSHWRNTTSASPSSFWSYPYVLNVGINLTSSISAFVEIFGRFENIDYPSFDWGGSYVVGRNFIIDLFGGFQTTGTPLFKSWFAEAGLTYRVDWRKKKGDAKNSK